MDVQNPDHRPPPLKETHLLSYHDGKAFEQRMVILSIVIISVLMVNLVAVAVARAFELDPDQIEPEPRRQPPSPGDIDLEAGRPQHVKTSSTRKVKAGPSRHTKAGPSRHTTAGASRHTKASPSRHTEAGPSRHVEPDPSLYFRIGPFRYLKSDFAGDTTEPGNYPDVEPVHLKPGMRAIPGGAIRFWDEDTEWRGYPHHITDPTNVLGIDFDSV